MGMFCATVGGASTPSEHVVGRKLVLFDSVLDQIQN